MVTGEEGTSVTIHGVIKHIDTETSGDTLLFDMGLRICFFHKNKLHLYLDVDKTSLTE